MDAILGRPRRTRVCVASLGFLVWSAAVSAQSNTPPLPSRSLFHTGPVAFYPMLTISDAGLDQNVLSDNTEPREDYTYTVTPRLQASLPIGGMRVIGTGTAGFVYFRTLKDQQTLNGLMSARLETPEGRLRPFGEAYLARTRDRSDVDVLRRVRRTKTGGAAGVDVQVSSVTALTGWAQRADTLYQDGELYQGVNLAEALNHRSDLMAGGARFTLTPFTTLVTAVEYERHRFDRSAARDADSLRIGPTVELANGAVISGRFSAGYRDFSPLNLTLPRYRGFVGNARATYTLLDVTRFDLEADRDVDFSFDGTQPYFLQSGVRLSVSQRVVGPLDLLAVAGRRHVNYQAQGSITAAQVDTIVESGIGFAIRANQDLRLTVLYDTLDRRSNGRFGRELQRRRVFASMTLAPQ